LIVDAGGLAVEGGGRICRGRLFRVSGALVVPDDLRRFERLGLRALIDLRGRSEERALLEQWTARAGVRYVWLPIEVARGSDLARAVAEAHDADHAADALAVLYREILDGHGRELAGAISVIAQGTPVAFGCAAGKDRTGLAAALLQLLLGAAEDEVVSSYASAPPTVEVLRGLVADYFTAQAAPPHLDVLLGAEEETMRRALDHIQSRYSGVEAYLLANGLPSDVPRLLRQELVED